MKKFIIILILFILIFLPLEKTLAQQTTDAQNREVKAATDEKNDISLKNGMLVKLKEAAKKQVENRIEELNKLIIKIDNDKKIPDSQKETLKKDVNDQITKLAELISKINQSGDEPSLRELYKQLLSEKIYSYYVQKTRLLIIIERLLLLEDKLTQLSAQLQNLIDKLNKTGAKVDALQNALDDMNTKLADIKKTLEEDKTKIETTAPDSYQETFLEVRNDFAKVKNDFAKIRADIAKVRGAFQDIKSLNANLKTSVTSSTSANPTVE